MVGRLDARDLVPKSNGCNWIPLVTDVVHEIAPKSRQSARTTKVDLLKFERVICQFNPYLFGALSERLGVCEDDFLVRELLSG